MEYFANVVDSSQAGRSVDESAVYSGGFYSSSSTLFNSWRTFVTLRESTASYNTVWTGHERQAL